MKQEWNPIVQYILNRLKEKSTWVSLGTALTGMGVVIAPDKWQMIMAIGMGVPGIISVFLPNTVMEKNITASVTATDLSKSLEATKPEEKK